MLVDGLPWGPAVDGDLIPRPTIDALRAGVGADIPLVLGATDDEFTMALNGVKNKLRLVPAGLALGKLGAPTTTRRAYLADNGPQRRKGTAAVLGRYVSDMIFRVQVPRIAAARTGASGGTWAYRFAWVSPTIGWACHCLDVPFWFDCLDSDTAALAGDAPPRALAEALHGSAVAFIRDSAPGWPAWTAATAATRMFGGDASRPDVQNDGYASVRALI